RGANQTCSFVSRLEPRRCSGQRCNHPQQTRSTPLDQKPPGLPLRVALAATQDNVPGERPGACHAGKIDTHLGGPDASAPTLPILACRTSPTATMASYHLPVSLVLGEVLLS